MTTVSTKKECHGDGDGGGVWYRLKAWLKPHLVWNTKLIPLKLAIFTYNGGVFAFLPYLTLHMRQLGITVQEMAICYAFLPIASLLGPPISGLLADRLDYYKLVLSANIVVTSVLHLSLLYVPPRPVNPLTFQCSPSGQASLAWDYCHPCHNVDFDDDMTTLQLSLKNCRYQCDAPGSKNNDNDSLTLCFQGNLHLDPSLDDHCHTFQLSQEITINGSLRSWERQLQEVSAEDKVVSAVQEVEGMLGEDATTCGHDWYQILQGNETYGSVSCPSSDCQVECEVDGFPACLHPDDPSASSTTFWIYFALRLSATFFLASAFTMLDATTMAMVKQHGSDYGKQRVLGTSGQAFIPLISGMLVDYHSSLMGYSDYSPAFYVGVGLILLASLTVVGLHVKVDVSNQHVLKDLKQLMGMVEVNLFLIVFMVMGSNMGFIESYLFLYLKELNAPTYLLGLTLTVGCAAAVPVMYVSDMVVKKLGRPAIFMLSFLCYTVRHMGYANITDPWMAFPFELLELFTYQIMWVAACTLCPILAPKGLLATMTGLAGAVHYSVGRGVGALLGGYLIAAYGLANTFQIFAIFSLAGGAVYLLLHFCFLKKRLQAKEAEMEAELKEERRKQEEEELQPMMEVKG